MRAPLVQVMMLEHEVLHTKDRLREWMAPQWVDTPMWLVPAWSEVRREPYGVLLAIAPFNYPLQVSTHHCASARIEVTGLVGKGSFVVLAIAPLRHSTTGCRSAGLSPIPDVHPS
jgi:hypothetical protein